MDPKAKSALDKALQEKVRGNHDKALKKLQEAIRKFPSEPELYIEAAEVCFEGGESLGATQFLKKAHTRFADERDRIVEFARERASTSNDPVVGKFLLEQLVKRRELTAALECLNDLQDRAIRDLLQRSRTKRQSLTSATAGGYALKGEMITNALSEALLCLRLGRFKEAVRTLLHLVEEKPVENEVLEPFFARLEKAHPKSGRVRVGYAASLLAANNPEAAMTRFVQAATIERPLADECLERIRDYRNGIEQPPASVDLATVEILLIRPPSWMRVRTPRWKSWRWCARTWSRRKRSPSTTCS
jgi:tetratricopeptide (TPR) repeat protein